MTADKRQVGDVAGIMAIYYCEIKAGTGSKCKDSRTLNYCSFMHSDFHAVGLSIYNLTLKFRKRVHFPRQS